MTVAALASLAILGCVRWLGMPDLPPHMVNDSALYRVGKKEFAQNVARARKIVRDPAAGFQWLLAGTAGERFVLPSEVRDTYAGIIFVGDSQIREISWAALKLLVGDAALRFDERDPVFSGGRGGRKNLELRNQCVPQSVGKTGFTATCDRASSCRLHSPFHNKSHAEAMRKLLLTRPHDWDGSLSLDGAACTSDFFVSYQATWGAIPVKPLTLPRCMHPRSADDTFGVERAGARKPVLWVMDGGGLHEMEYCDPRRWSLPQHVLRLFPDAVLRRSVVWQPAGGGFLMRATKRFKGECAEINAHAVADQERAYLDGRGVRHYDYPSLALQFAPLMFDAIHFTYYWVPCREAFPEMARLVAQLALQQAFARPLRVCSTAEELAQPAAAATALSFAVPLDPNKASTGAEAAAARATAAAAADAPPHAAATRAGAAGLKAGAAKGLGKGLGKAVRKEVQAACAGASGALRALCDENAALRAQHSRDVALRRAGYPAAGGKSN